MKSISLALILSIPAVMSHASEPTRASRAAKIDIVDTAVQAGSFKTLAAALQAAGLVDTLKGEGPFTVFAPTDEAFAKLPAGTEGLHRHCYRLGHGRSHQSPHREAHHGQVAPHSPSLLSADPARRAEVWVPQEPHLCPSCILADPDTSWLPVPGLGRRGLGVAFLHGWKGCCAIPGRAPAVWIYSYSIPPPSYFYRRLP